MIHIPLINGVEHDKLTTYSAKLEMKVTNARSVSGRLISDWQYYYYNLEMKYEMLTQDEKDRIETELQKDFILEFIPTDASSSEIITRTFRVLQPSNVSRGQIYDLTEEILWRDFTIKAECITPEVRSRE